MRTAALQEKEEEKHGNCGFRMYLRYYPHAMSKTQECTFFISSDLFVIMIKRVRCKLLCKSTQENKLRGIIHNAGDTLCGLAASPHSGLSPQSG